MKALTPQAFTAAIAAHRGELDQQDAAYHAARIAAMQHGLKVFHGSIGQPHCAAAVAELRGRKAGAADAVALDVDGERVQLRRSSPDVVTWAFPLDRARLEAVGVETFHSGVDAAWVGVARHLAAGDPVGRAAVASLAALWRDYCNPLEREVHLLHLGGALVSAAALLPEHALRLGHVEVIDGGPHQLVHADFSTTARAAARDGVALADREGPVSDAERAADADVGHAVASAVGQMFQDELFRLGLESALARVLEKDAQASGFTWRGIRVGVRMVYRNPRPPGISGNTFELDFGYWTPRGVPRLQSKANLMADSVPVAERLLPFLAQEHGPRFPMSDALGEAFTTTLTPVLAAFGFGPAVEVSRDGVTLHLTVRALGDGPDPEDKKVGPAWRRETPPRQY